MSRSYKKYPIVKISGYLKNVYWKIVRRRIKMAIHTEQEVLPEPKEIVGDWDYIDYISNCESHDRCWCLEIYGRKKCKEK